VTQYHRLTKPSKGISAKFMRHFYNSVAVPKMLYATDLFLIPESSRSECTRLAKIQRQVSLHITSTMRLASMDAIDTCADILPFPLIMRVSCLSHFEAGNTTQAAPLEWHNTRVQSGTSTTTGHSHMKPCMPLESTPPTSRPSIPCKYRLKWALLFPI